MKRLVIFISLFGLALSVGLYMVFFQDSSQKTLKNLEIMQADMAKAKEFLAEKKTDDAIVLISQYLKKMDQQEIDSEWVQMAVRAYGEIGDPFNSVALYRSFPEKFRSEEKASLLVARVAAYTKDLAMYNKMRESWKGREDLKARWNLIEIDRLMLTGDFDGAKDLVISETYTGTDEVERLIFLARLTAQTDVNKAWETLLEAQKIDPKYPELYVWRGRIAELGKRLSVAQKEYATAVRLTPENPVLRDQLGEFYRRYQQYKFALQAWAGGLENSSSDALWLKTYFWSRVAYPVQIDWKGMDLPSGDNREFVAYLLEVSNGDFWDHNEFTKLEHGAEFLNNRQEAFWLRLLQFLKKGEERKAWQLMQENPFKMDSWHTELEIQLKRILSYRLFGTLEYDATPTIQGSKGRETIEKTIKNNPMRHQLFQHLDRLVEESENGSDQLVYLLNSENAYAAVFLAGGWLEAALQLRRSEVFSEKYPDWLSFGIAQSIRQNRGEAEALQFAKEQPASEPLNLIIAEMQGSTGDFGGAFSTFQTLLDAKNQEVSLRAAWCAAMILIQDKDYSKARTLVEAHRELKDHINGKEILSRIALLEGDIDLADRLYALLEKESSEAKSYLANRAYQMKQWKRAKELTEAILKEKPTHPVFRENLRRIDFELESDW